MKPNISLCGTLTLLSKVWEVKGILKYEPQCGCRIPNKQFVRKEARGYEFYIPFKKYEKDDQV